MGTLLAGRPLSSDRPSSIMIAAEHTRELPMRPVTHEILSPERFVEVYERSRGNIERTEVLAPSISDSHFGGVRVWYKRPVYRSVNVFKRKERG